MNSHYRSLRNSTRMLVIVCAFAAQAHILSAAEPETTEHRLNDQTFTVAKDYTVELAAPSNLVARPITCDLDERGRLYVAESSGSNDPVQKQLAERPHRILRLEDTNGDGVYDKRTVFADKMMLPQGTMWLGGSLYVAAPPSIWKLTDTNDDGVADRREEWFKGKTLTGCANDLHGPYRGRDGWIYWCKGAFAEQTYDLPGKKNWKTRASHVFRARPDGTGIEPVMTGGMDNPVDVVFTPEGERLVLGTFFVHPGGGHRDGILHAIYGGVYGKDHPVLDGHPRTGSLMPIMTHLGPAAPCGMHLIEHEHYGNPAKRDVDEPQVICCQFNLRKVSHHVLRRSGGTFTTTDTDLLTSDSMDFHPTDVIEDGDGSLLVCDTGGWYKLCCPTSQFHKPESLGAIYRLRRKDARPTSDPFGESLDWANLSELELANLWLDNRRQFVERRALEELVRRKEIVLAVLCRVLEEGRNGPDSRHVIWALCRIDAPEAREAIRQMLTKETSEGAVIAAIHTCALWRDSAARFRLVGLLDAKSPAVRRAAAEALGRMGDKSVAALLLARLETETDRPIEHSLIYAAIELAAADEARAALASSSARVQRGALLALAAMPEAKLAASEVLPLLMAADEFLRDAAWNVAEKRESWSESLTELLKSQLDEVKDDAASALVDRLARLSNRKTIANLLATTAGDEKHPAATRRVALAAMALAHPRPLPDAWSDALRDNLAQADLLPETIAALAGQTPSKTRADPVRQALLDAAASHPEIRLAALTALPASALLDDPSFQYLLAHLNRDAKPSDRAAALDVLTRAKISTRQLTPLAATSAELTPLEITRLLPSFENADAAAIDNLFTALEKSPALESLAAGSLRPLVDKLPADQKTRGERLIARIDDAAGQRTERLESLVARLAELKPDAQRGRAIFHNKKAACATCHAIAYVGGQTGPDLTRIGQIRAERDLVEAVVFPSASFVRSYEPVAVATASGERHSGIVRRDTAEELVLATAADKEVRIAREEIDEIRPGSVSIMPEGMDKVLSEQDLADLVAFLKACRQ